MKYLTTLLAAAAFAFTMTSAAFASDAKPAASADVSVSYGEIKKVDQEAGKLTIKHGELKNLTMPAMTMVFDVKDNAALSQLKTGDKISFVAGNANGELTASNIRVVQ
jgi:Cu(I)/Ag(I) efflux system protein CusF